MECEQHKPQFQGVWIPRHVMEAVWAGTITTTEAMLLATIDALSKRSHGCHASNAYLMGTVGLASTSERHLRDMLRRLKGLGYLVQLSGPGDVPRRLATRWTAAIPNDNNGQTPSISGGSTEPPPRTEGALGSRPPGSVEPPYSTADNTNPLAPGGPLGDLLDCTPPSTTTKEEQTTPTLGIVPHAPAIAEAYNDNAQRFYEALRAAGKVLVPPRLTDWARDFQRLEQVNGLPPERVRLVLEWYCVHFRDRYVPVAYSAATFRKKFLDIEAAMERAGQDAAAAQAKAKMERDAGVADEPNEIEMAVVELARAERWNLPIPDATILQIAQATLNGYKLYRRTLTGVALPRQHLQGLVDYMRASGGQPLEFTRQWMRRLVDYTSTGHGLAAPYLRYAMTMKSKTFERQWFTTARKHNPNGNGPDLLWKALQGVYDAGNGKD